MSLHMLFKKFIPVLFILSATFGYAGSKAPASPPPTQQVTPASPQSDDDTTPASPMPAPVAPGQEVPAPLPSSNDMTNSYESAFVRMLVTLLGLILLVFLTFWVLRRMGKGKFKMGSSRHINVIERRAVSPKTMLYIIEIGDKKVLISESQVEVRALTTIEEVPEIND
jgi:flagellar biogenesis protein FliO